MGTSVKQRNFTSFKKFGVNLTWGLVIALILVLILGKFIKDLNNDQLIVFDERVSDFIHGLNGPFITKIAVFVTHMGGSYVEAPIFLIVGSFLLFKLKHLWDTVLLGCALLGGWLLNLMMKMIFQRERPSIEHLVEVGGYSFPSGHAMVSTAFYGMVGYLLWLNLKKSGKSSWYVVFIMIMFILSIGASRVYLGVHYPSDVIAGFAAGGVWLIACIFALHAIRYYKSEQ